VHPLLRLGQAQAPCPALLGGVWLALLRGVRGVHQILWVGLRAVGLRGRSWHWGRTQRANQPTRHWGCAEEAEGVHE